MIQLKKLASGLAGSALLLGTMASGALAADVTISDNGFGSINTVLVASGCKSKVAQSNYTSVTTVASVSANSGGNQASGNTGGNVSVASGPADAALLVSVEGGSNEASVSDCCLCGGTDSVAIEGNGSLSKNTVSIKQFQSTKTVQSNKTKVTTVAKVKANSGKNKANGNTGSGVDVTSDSASAGLGVSVTASENLVE